ncbi:MAG: M28 family metallopeptidase, partial [Promethearchaeota archaeon]
EVPKISGKVMIEFIRDVCSQIGGRPGTSAAEKKTGDLIEREFSQFCDSTTQERFECHPKAFFDFIWMTVGFFTLAIIFYPFFPLFTAFFILIGLLLFFGEQVLLWEVVDRLFPKKTSANIIGRISSAGSVKGTVLLGAHHDSAYEFTLFRHLGKKSLLLINTTVLLALIAMILAVAKTLAIHFKFSERETIDFLQIPILALSFMLLLLIALTLHSSQAVLGANDNLSGVAVILEAGKAISQNRPQNVDVLLVSFGCEELMRGSKRYVERHSKELQGPHDVLLNIDNVGAGDLQILQAEKMVLTKHSKKAVKMAEQAAIEAGLEIPTIDYIFAASDACHFSKKNIDAVSILAMGPHGMPVNWHSRTDIPETLEEDILEQSVKFAVSFVKIVDQLAAK